MCRHLLLSIFCQQQFRAVEKETGRAAFIHLDMRFAVAHHAAVRRHHGAERKTIRRSSGRNPEHRHLAPEEPAERLLEVLIGHDLPKKSRPLSPEMIQRMLNVNIAEMN